MGLVWNLLQHGTHHSNPYVAIPWCISNVWWLHVSCNRMLLRHAGHFNIDRCRLFNTLIPIIKIILSWLNHSYHGDIQTWDTTFIVKQDPVYATIHIVHLVFVLYGCIIQQYCMTCPYVDTRYNKPGARPEVIRSHPYTVTTPIHVSVISINHETCGSNFTRVLFHLFFQ